MFGRRSITLARVAGVRIGVHPSWFAVLFLFILLFSRSFEAALDASETVAYATAVGAVLLFFASLVLHELAHALVALRQGIEVTSIDLWLLGGVATLRREADTPGGEFRIAGAGPLATALVVAGCVGAGLALAGPDELRAAAELRGDGALSPGIVLLAWVASSNLVLLLFNLIPAYPLDGGRMLRAAIWRATGSRRRATRAASGLGQAFGIVLMGLGIYALLRGDLVTGIWGLFGGGLLGQVARAERGRAAVSERLEGVTAADVMDAEPVTVPAGMAGEQVREEYFLRYRYPWFAVVDGAGRFQGVVREDAALEGAERPVGELVDPAATAARVAPDAPLEALLGSEALRELGAVAVVDADDVLRGVVELEQVRRAVVAAVQPEAEPR